MRIDICCQINIVGCNVILQLLRTIKFHCQTAKSTDSRSTCFRPHFLLCDETTPISSQNKKNLGALLVLCAFFYFLFSFSCISGLDRMNSESIPCILAVTEESRNYCFSWLLPQEVAVSHVMRHEATEKSCWVKIVKSITLVWLTLISLFSEIYTTFHKQLNNDLFNQPRNFSAWMIVRNFSHWSVENRDAYLCVASWEKRL